MKRHGALLLLLAVLAGLMGGLAVLFRLRLAQGDVFPAYSSLRSDPLGTRALHDSLAQLPALRVERQFKPIVDLEPTPARAIVMAGVHPRSWTRVLRAEFDALDAAVRGGSRLVIAMRAQAAQTEEEKEEEKKAEERAKKKGADEDEEEKPKMAYMDLQRRWGADVTERMLMERGDVARRTEDERAIGVPESIAWRSDVFFKLAPNAGWHVIYRRGSEPVLAERSLGLGSIVLVADSYFLSNEALQRDRAPALLAWIVGAHSHVVFDEAHLGVVVNPGVAALARRYGLSGAFFTLLLLAALFVWRRMALFVPPAAADAAEVALTYHPAAGLEALLRRSVQAEELAAACATEWRPTARESDRARVDAVMAVAPKDSSPVALYNAAVKALKRTKNPERTKDQGPRTKDLEIGNGNAREGFKVPGP